MHPKYTVAHPIPLKNRKNKNTTKFGEKAERNPITPLMVKEMRRVNLRPEMSARLPQM